MSGIEGIPMPTQASRGIFLTTFSLVQTIKIGSESAQNGASCGFKLIASAVEKLCLLGVFPLLIIESLGRLAFHALTICSQESRTKFFQTLIGPSLPSAFFAILGKN